MFGLFLTWVWRRAVSSRVEGDPRRLGPGNVSRSTRRRAPALAAPQARRAARWTHPRPGAAPWSGRQRAVRPRSRLHRSRSLCVPSLLPLVAARGPGCQALESPAAAQLGIYSEGRCCPRGSGKEAPFCIPASSAPPGRPSRPNPPSASLSGDDSEEGGDSGYWSIDSCWD